MAKDALNNLLETDGRRRRAAANRDAIVRAMFELIRAGDMNPSAAAVAAAADVGLRTVYRHFDDIDSIYREMAKVLEEKHSILIVKPLFGTGLLQRLEETIDRRVPIYEDIMPIRLASIARRFSSEFLMADYERSLKLEEQMVKVAVKPFAPLPTDAYNAILVAMSFQTWNSLRHDQRLSARKSKAAVMRIIRGIVAEIEA